MNPSARIAAGAALLLLSGCASYRFGNPVPPALRQVAVPAFENACAQPEAEAVLTQAVCREIVREGSLKLAPPDRGAIRIHGRVTAYDQTPIRYSPADAETPVEFRVRLTAVVSVTEVATGSVLLAPTALAAETTALTRGDLPTARRDALHRAARELGRQIVQTVVGMW